MDHPHLVGLPGPLQMPSQVPPVSLRLPLGSPQIQPKSHTGPRRAATGWGSRNICAQSGEGVPSRGTAAATAPKQQDVGRRGGYDTSGLVGPEGQLRAQRWGAPGGFRVREGQGRSPAGTKAVGAGRGLRQTTRPAGDPGAGIGQAAFLPAPEAPGWGAGQPGRGPGWEGVLASGRGPAGPSEAVIKGSSVSAA